MKKKLLFLFIMLLLPTMVFAKDFKITNTDITNVVFPDNWYVITRDNFYDVYEDIGLSESFYSLMTINDYYLDAISNEKTYEVIMLKKSNSTNYPNYNSLDDATIIKSGENSQFSGKNLSVYKTNYNKYLNAVYVDTSTSKITYIQDYLTIYNNTLYQFKVQKYGLNFTETEKQLVKDIIDSIQYQKYENNTITDNNEADNETNNIKDLLKNILPYIIVIIVIIIIIIIVLVIVFIKKSKKQNSVNNTVNAINYQTNYDDSQVTHLQENNIYDSNAIEENMIIKKTSTSDEEIKQDNVNPIMDIKIENTDNDENKNS